MADRTQQYLALVLLVAAQHCASEPPAIVDPIDTEPAVSKPTRSGPPVRLTPLAADAEIAPFGVQSLGGLEVSFVNARTDAISSYAAVSVGGAALQWLDLHTDAERAAGASPESGWGWVHVELAPDGHTLVGVLDWFVESSGPELHVVASTDGGLSWSQRAVVAKPHYMALFEGIELRADRWRLFVWLDDCGGCGVPAGVFAWTSEDAGFTWRAQ